MTKQQLNPSKIRNKYQKHCLEQANEKHLLFLLYLLNQIAHQLTFSQVLLDLPLVKQIINDLSSHHYLVLKPLVSIKALCYIHTFHYQPFLFDGALLLELEA
jgi:hypothetical protein